VAKRAYHHGDLKRALVDATLLLLKTEAAESLTLREVARRVGVDHTAAYRHFEDKRALFADVAEEGFRQLAEDMRKSVAKLQKKNAQVRLRALARAYVAFAIAHPEHYRVMMGPRLNVEGRFPGLESAVMEAYALLLDEVKRGLLSKTLRRAEKPQDLTMSVWTMAHGFSTLVLLGRLRTKSPAIALRYFDTVVDPLIEGLKKTS
jgi:AcrR family transcriptional regulator